MSARQVDPILLNELLRYDAESGKLFWRPRSVVHFKCDGDAKRWNTRYEDQEAFTALDDKGYFQGTVLGRRQLKHRVIIAMLSGQWPSQPVDHVSGDKLDNRAANLRVASVKENQQNQPISSRNKSGVVGVYHDRRSGKWRASIGGRGLGLHSSMESAVSARAAAQAEAGYHPNHGRKPKNFII